MLSLSGQELAEIEEMLLAEIVEELEEDVDVSEVIERLRFYRKYPLDLNRVNEQQLAALLFLSPVQVQSILRHRAWSGAFISVLELQAVEGLDALTQERLLPFVTVGSPDIFSGLTFKNLLSESEQNIMLRYDRVLEPKRGYLIVDTTRSRYLGDANAYLVRYRLNYRDQIRIAVNAKKDAGEPFFREKQRYGFDHYGVSIYVKGRKRIEGMVVGDYALQVGQGLVIWNGLSFGKGAMITSSARQGIGLRPYTSVNSYNFLRGISAHIRFREMSLTPFISLRKLSGNLEPAETGNIIKSISTTGLHRTPTEQRYRHAITQTISGINLDYRRGRLKVGLIGMYTGFNGRLDPADILRNRFAFRGQHLLNTGVNFQFTYSNLYVYGETAHQLQKGWATNHGVIVSAHPKVSFFANYRDYQRDYYAFFAQSLGEGSRVTNERGLYSGMVYHPNRQIEWLTYVDMFRFPWLRFRVDAPSSGIDFLSQFTFRWYKVGRLSIRYRYRERPQNMTGEEPENTVVETQRRQLRIDFRYRLSAQWEVRTRTDGVVYTKANEDAYGGLLYQDVFYRLSNNRLQLNLRLALFHTDSYDARIYAFENDVLYANSFPLYHDKGWRSYVNVRYRIAKRMDIWFRVAQTRFTNRETVGSGLEQIEGNKRTDIKVQMRYRW
ncbi:ComEA family DNA-binding protein [Sphingobacterium psychroaquaticum]|uniref:ComEA family DNA-binding protein n=1 Tax=Sphingobacterium psychroaquaticum TaxID=561061 RepID=UPI00141B27BC|nr:helix-hairpin-helix domain-containing protein [Sphingobacterium psychroaquaticum]